MARFKHAGQPFAAMHHALVDVAIDWSALRPEDLDPALLERARAAWNGRAQSEYQSIQVMTRFMGEVLAAGDPLEVQAGAVMAIEDEVRHTALCVGVVEALGMVATLPPLDASEAPGFLALPAAQRALATAITMLAINETVSVALIEDLQARATHPVVKAVLDATLADEDAHGDFGWAYVAASLGRFDGDGHDYARACAESAVQALVGPARTTVAGLSPHLRDLGRWPEPELAHLGLRSPEREALVIVAAVEQRVVPRLVQLGLWQFPGR